MLRPLTAACQEVFANIFAGPDGLRAAIDFESWSARWMRTHRSEWSCLMLPLPLSMT
jgi:hypothetical protein